jgi:signal transduction histidine kinase
MEAPTEGINSRKIVNEVLLRLESRIKETKAKVLIEPNLPILYVNITWATQAIYNLVANALKFTRADEPPKIEIGAYNVNNQTGLVVRDRGIGIAPEHAVRIFQLFQRAVGREVDGTGAGLAIVHQVAERHGGRAWVQPREGGGSEFIITFNKLSHEEKGD